MTPKFTVMRGTRDILPPESAEWQHVEAVFRDLAGRFGYREIRTPVFEARDLFVHGTGEATDVVTKEMYDFQDKKGRWLCLRPEGTPPVVRAYLEQGLARQGLPAKLFYQGPMFRYDRPAAGRYRQFHQFGVEAIGSGSALLDAEIIHLLHAFLEELGLRGLESRLNSLGDAVCRPRFRERLVEFFAPVVAELCEDCQVRYRRNPLRILDCKVPACRAKLEGAPTPMDTLCDGCREHQAAVEGQLSAWGVPYRLDGRLVRGLDYYTRTVFETYAPAASRENALGGGGRYDGLVEICGGPATPATGFAAGVERILDALRSAAAPLPAGSRTDVFLAVQDPAFAPRAAASLAELRRSWGAQMDYDGRGLKGQLKTADRVKARYVVFFAQEEMARGEVRVRDMDGSAETMVREADLPGWLRERLATTKG